jgi:DNA mismatch repair protein MutL
MGLVLLDRRAAHERIWYERLREQFQQGGVPVQQLLLPVSIELSPVDSVLLTDHLAFLRGHGFEFSGFGRDFFRLEALPAWMEPGDVEAFVRDLVGAWREGRMPGNDGDLAREELARMAAAKAVRLPSFSGERRPWASSGNSLRPPRPSPAPPGTRPTSS